MSRNSNSNSNSNSNYNKKKRDNTIAGNTTTHPLPSEDAPLLLSTSTTSSSSCRQSNRNNLRSRRQHHSQSPPVHRMTMTTTTPPTEDCESNNDPQNQNQNSTPPFYDSYGDASSSGNSGSKSKSKSNTANHEHEHEQQALVEQQEEPGKSLQQNTNELDAPVPSSSQQQQQQQQPPPPFSIPYVAARTNAAPATATGHAQHVVHANYHSLDPSTPLHNINISDHGQFGGGGGVSTASSSVSAASSSPPLTQFRLGSSGNSQSSSVATAISGREFRGTFYQEPNQNSNATGAGGGSVDNHNHHEEKTETSSFRATTTTAASVASSAAGGGHGATSATTSRISSYAGNAPAAGKDGRRRDDRRGMRSPPNSPGDDARSQGPLLEIPEEVYAVRKAALKVLKPLTKTWIIISVGFALAVLFGMARWTRLIPDLPYWFILLPCWSSHAGLLWLHVLSAKALSTFIAQANDSRQRPDSRDHLNRTEYLPLLQRSLKFGFKTGLLSFLIFFFEILTFCRLARGRLSLNASLAPLWLLVVGGVLDGIVCRTQHFLRVLCWILAFCAMALLVAKVDYGADAVRWRFVLAPVVALLSIASASLIYIVYGHQLGYYRLTEAQLTAGNLYSLAALICMIMIVMIGEVIPLSRPVEVETRLFVVILAPLVVCLVGMGAWVVSRDEFGRLLLYGGQSAVHPMKLRWEESRGWDSVQGEGVTVIPMFGEVAFRPLERKSLPRSRRSDGDGSTASQTAMAKTLELCSCCCYSGVGGGLGYGGTAAGSSGGVSAVGASLAGGGLAGGCYPYADDIDDDDGDEETGRLAEDHILYHPYLYPERSHNSYRTSRRM